MDEDSQKTCKQCGATFLGSTPNANATCSSCREAVTIAPFDPDATQMPSSGPASASGILVDTRARLDRYENQQQIGDWRFGKIFSGYHAELNCDVVIHTFSPPPELQEDATRICSLKEKYIQRIKAVAKATSACLPRVLEAGIINDDVFVVQPVSTLAPVESFSSRSFFGRWNEGLFPADSLNQFYLRLAEAVGEVHDRGTTLGTIPPNSIGEIQPGQPFVQGVFSNLDDSELPFEVAVKNDIAEIGRVVIALTCPKISTDQLSRQETSQALVSLLRWHNPGLSRTVCHALAGSLLYDRDSISTIGTLLGRLGQIADSSRLPEARTRFFSAFLDFILAAVLVGLLGIYAPGSGAYRMIIILSSIVLFSVVQETVFGTTLMRWLFSLRIHEYSGQRASYLRSFCRVVGKWALLLGTVVASAFLVVSLRGLIPAWDNAFVSFFSPIGLLLLVVFVPTFLFRSRLTFYDAIAGATWAESIAEVGSQSVAGKLGTQEHGAISSPIDRIDQFRILSLLGAGGMGQVFLAYDETIDRYVAIKVLPADFVQDGDAYLRFQREARLAAKIRHPRIAAVLGFGQWKQQPYIAMELIKGEDLGDLVEREGAQPVGRVWDLLIQAVEGLDAASQNGVIHRDIKPSNLMLDQTGSLKVMDFGISFDPADEEDESKSGVLIGTPTYMSPEQADQREVDLRSDMYSLGLTAIYLLSGRKPFVGDTFSILAQKMEGIDLSRPEFNEIQLDHEQTSLIHRMVETNRNLRFPSYSELKTELLATHPAKLVPATLTQRITATVLDGFVFYMANFIATLSIMLLAPRLPAYSPTAVEIQLFLTNKMVVQVLPDILAFTFFAILYFRGLLKQGQSTGKRVLRLAVRKDQARALGVWDVTLRFLATFPYIALTPLMVSLRRPFPDFEAGPWLLGLNVIFFLISTAWVAWGTGSQSIADWLTGTQVMHRKSPD